MTGGLLARRGGVLLAAALPVVGLVELALHLWFARRPPTPADWAAAAPALSALRRPGEPVIIAPSWAEPHARVAFGEALMPLRDVARPDESRYRRVLEVSALGQRTPSLHDWPLVEQRALGDKLEVRLLANPRPVRLTYDFVDGVERGEASVSWDFADRTQPCPLRDGEPTTAGGLFGMPTMPARRHVCGPQSWQSVGVTVHEDEGYRPRRCLWSHPPEGGAVHLRFERVPLGRTLRGHASIHWTLEREQRGAPFTIEVAVDGEVLEAIRHDDGQGWRPFELPLGAHAGASAARVDVRLSAPTAYERHVCWEMDSREPDR